MTTKHELEIKRWNVRNSRDTLTAQPHQLVSNRSEKQVNDRNNRARSHSTLRRTLNIQYHATANFCSVMVITSA